MAPQTRRSSTKDVPKTTDERKGQFSDDTDLKSGKDREKKKERILNVKCFIESNVPENSQITDSLDEKSSRPTENNYTDQQSIDSEVTEDDDFPISDGTSSSSAEDSDDDYEKEFKISSKRFEDSDCSSDDEQNDENIIRRMQMKFDGEFKKNRLLHREKKYFDGLVSDDDDILCDYESSELPKLRKRRLYRRKMMASSGTVKRRRIRRLQSEKPNEYTCDTFVEFGTTLSTLTSDIEWDDTQIDRKAVRKLFKELDSDNEFSDDMEEDDADIVSNTLPVYQSRNSKERVSQMIELKVTPFSEKLACYNSRKAVNGSSRSSIQNYHPAFLIKQDFKLPEELLWEQPLKHLLYLPTKFDAHEKCNTFLNTVFEDKKRETEMKMLAEIKERVNEKAMERKYSLPTDHEKLEVTSSQISFIDDQMNEFSDIESFDFGDDYRDEYSDEDSKFF